MSSGVGRRHGSDLGLLWLRCRPAAVAPIGPLAWEPPCAEGVALKRKEKKKKKKGWRERKTESSPCGSVVMNLTSIHEDVDLTPTLAEWVEDTALL